MGDLPNCGISRAVDHMFHVKQGVRKNTKRRGRRPIGSGQGVSEVGRVAPRDPAAPGASPRGLGRRDRGPIRRAPEAVRGSLLPIRRLGRTGPSRRSPASRSSGRLPPARWTGRSPRQRRGLAARPQRKASRRACSGARVPVTSCLLGAGSPTRDNSAPFGLRGTAPRSGRPLGREAEPVAARSASRRSLGEQEAIPWRWHRSSVPLPAPSGPRLQAGPCFTWNTPGGRRSRPRTPAGRESNPGRRH